MLNYWKYFQLLFGYYVGGGVDGDCVSENAIPWHVALMAQNEIMLCLLQMEWNVECIYILGAFTTDNEWH